MKILIIDNGTRNLDYIKKLVKGQQLSIVKAANVTLERTKVYDLIILTGAGLDEVPYVYDSDEILKEEINVIKHSDKPIIGICYGFELIAYAFGCKVVSVPIILNGNIDIRPRSYMEHIFGLRPEVQVYENHRLVVQELSDEIESLAESDFGFEVIKHKTRPIYGLQFHPEKETLTTEGDEIFKNIISELHK